LKKERKPAVQHVVEDFKKTGFNYASAKKQKIENTKYGSEFYQAQY